MKAIQVLLSLICIAVLFSSCKEKEQIAELSVNTEMLSFKAKGEGAKTIQVSATGDWSVTSGAPEWCTARRSGNSLRVEVNENTGKNLRTTTVRLTSGNLVAEFEVQQFGQETVITFSQSAFTFDAVGNSTSVVVSTNSAWKIVAPEWIVTDVQAIDSEDVDHTITLSAVTHSGGEERSGSVVFEEIDGEGKGEITVYQKALSGYTQIEPSSIKGDIKVDIKSGNASSYQNGEGIEKCFDGDYSTIYHSSWNNSAGNYFPITLTFNLEGDQDVNYMIYYPRTNGGNGHFKETEIWVAYDAARNSFSKLMDKDFGGKGATTILKFDSPLEKPTAVRIVVKSGAGDGQGFASSSEIEFYRYDTDAFNPLSLFVDDICSALRPEVTMEAVEACPVVFYKNLALHMLNGQYDVTYRVQEYKPYPVPETESRERKTSTYSRLDNPTGMVAIANKEAVIFAEGIPDEENVSVMVQNLDHGYGGSSYALHNGVNKIKPDRGGLMYVMYNTDNHKTAPKIRIHFASGKVNGLFDTGNRSGKFFHKREDWDQIINSTTDKFFDLVGEYAHMSFPVSEFRKYTNNGYDLIARYDSLVMLEQHFMGLKKYDKMFGNRMFFVGIYDSYMYATSYRTAYNVGTCSTVLNEHEIESSPWGPAHEVGHCNQTRPGLKWLGTTEVTNNIMSLYIQTHWRGYSNSRIQSEDMGVEGRNRYEKAMNSTFTHDLSHAMEEDVFCKLVPFWQLYLYTKEVKNQGDFYADVYEHVRNNPDLDTDGKHQTEFALTCCKYAKLDLTEFFEKWGFLREVNAGVDDYGSGSIAVSKARVDEIKQAIAALGYSKPTHDVSRITDENYEAFKTNQAYSKGTIKRNGNVFTMSGFKGVAAYEIDNEEGKLIYVSPNPAGFDMKKTPISTKPKWTSGCKLYAIDIYGERTDITSSIQEVFN